MPDLSSASVRVSEIVSTAMLSGMKDFVSSILDMITLLRVPDAVQRCSAEPGPTHYQIAGPRFTSAPRRKCGLPRCGRGTKACYPPDPNVLQACTVPCW